MISRISNAVADVLKKHHDQFDVIWNESGAETHRLINTTEHGQKFLKELSEWFIKGHDLIESLKENNERV